MSSGGRGSVGFCGTTKNRIDSSASYTADYSGVGRRGRTLARCHAIVAIPVRMGGVGEMRSVTAMIADILHDRLEWCLTPFPRATEDTWTAGGCRPMATITQSVLVDVVYMSVIAHDVVAIL
jgi:hypothetical protein